MIPPANTRTLATRYVTVAEKLRDAGYATAHIGKWHLGADGYLPEHQGFDVNVGGYASGSPQGGYFPPYRNPSLSDGPPEEYLTDRLTDEALSFVTRSASQPFFLYLAHYAVHTPIQAKAALIAKYESRTPVGDQSKATYAAMIESMDRGVGRVLAHIDSLGLGPDTAVIFYSDNGGAIQATSNAPLRGFKGMLYEGGIRVPGIIEWPGHLEPRISNFPASTLDMFPTLIEVAGLDPNDMNEVHDGISLVPVFDTELPRRNQPIGLRVQGQLGWLDNDYKLIYYRDYDKAMVDGVWDQEVFDSLTQEWELYNLVDDPSEEDNLFEQQPEIAARMKAELAAWNESVDRSTEGADYPEGRVLPSGRDEAEP